MCHPTLISSTNNTACNNNNNNEDVGIINHLTNPKVSLSNMELFYLRLLCACNKDNGCFYETDVV